jgi:hypothetical protein
VNLGKFPAWRLQGTDEVAQDMVDLLVRVVRRPTEFGHMKNAKENGSVYALKLDWPFLQYFRV